MSLTAWIIVGVVVWCTPTTLLIWLELRPRKEFSIKAIGEFLFYLLLQIGGIYAAICGIYAAISFYRCSMGIASYLAPSPWHYLIMALLLLPFACVIKFIFMLSREHEQAEYERAVERNRRAAEYEPVSYTHLTLPTKRIV